MKMYFDGACSKNPGGISTWGAVIYDVGGRIYEIKGVVDTPQISTNNVAEYHGLIEAIKFIKKHRSCLPKIEVFGDSLLVINMASKKWGWKKGRYNPHPDKLHLKKLLEELHELTKGMMITYNWVPREQNEIADRLSKEALEEYKKPKEEEINIPLAINDFLKKLPVEELMGSDGIDEVGDSIFMFEFKYKGENYTITFK